MPKQAKPIPPPSQPRSRLGRGLSSLMDPAAPAIPAGPVAGPPAQATAAAVVGARPSDPQARQVPLDDIAPNPYQPRQTFDPHEIAQLAASIRRQGILQPLLLAPAPPGAEKAFILIAGERRLRAARQAGLESVPCVVRAATHRQMVEWSLIENIQRADLNPLERAAAYRHYMDRFALSQAEVAERTGQARASVANYLRLLELSDPVRAMLLAGELSFGHARALAGIAGQPGRQLALARRACASGLSVRQIERLVAADQDRPGGRRSAGASRTKAPYVRELEARLTRSVGTRVTIQPGRRKNAGRIVIDYYGLDDFDRIARALGLPDEAQEGLVHA
jgi:ParB family chromosome partitioning protein